MPNTNSAPKEMHVAHQIPAALEEVGDHAAAQVLEGNTPVFQRKHRPIVEALEKRIGGGAALLLRNRVETVLKFLKELKSDSGPHRALGNDLEDAREVHKAFFPQENLSISGLAYATFYQPARWIGGDYYDFLPLAADRWGIAVGDVCGKGIGAALLMASLQASLRVRAMHCLFRSFHAYRRR